MAAPRDAPLIGVNAQKLSTSQSYHAAGSSRYVHNLLRELRRLYGDRVEKPTCGHVTSWQEDPYSRGSYAYMTVGSAPDDHDLLAIVEPALKNDEIWIFVGKAFDMERLAGVDQAYADFFVRTETLFEVTDPIEQLFVVGLGRLHRQISELGQIGDLDLHRWQSDLPDCFM